MAARDRKRKQLEDALRKSRKRRIRRPSLLAPHRLPMHSPDILYNPPGLDKMSEVLEEFVDPYCDEDLTFEDYGALLMTGVAAWNAAVAPPGERRERLVEGYLKSLRGKHTAAEIEKVRTRVHELIHRKLTAFPLNSRCIVAMELSIQEDGSPHLRVASTLQPPPDLGMGEQFGAT
jgi:hypothetical protein